MLPVSAAQQGEFSFEDIHYCFQIPTIKSRAKFQKILASEGVFYPPDSELIRCLEKAVQEIVADDQKSELLAILELVEATGIAEVKEKDPELFADYTSMIEQLLPYSPAYARLIAERRYFFEMYPIIAIELFLLSSSGFEVKRVAGRITDDSLQQLPLSHVEPLGWHIAAHLSLSAETKKNSALPSPSQAGPERTNTEPSAEIPDGKSLESISQTTLKNL